MEGVTFTPLEKGAALLFALVVAISVVQIGSLYWW